MRPATFTRRRGALDGLGSPMFDVGEFGLQVAGERVDLEVVRERHALLAQRLQFLATLGDEFVFVVVDGLGGSDGGRNVVAGHAWVPV